MDSIVVKFGGSVLTNGEMIGKMAEMVKNEASKGKKMVVVVSALKNSTDNLISLAKQTSPKISVKDLDLIVSLGEQVTARLTYAALASIGVKTVLIEPSSNKWPIITDENFGNANPLMDECRKVVEREIKPLLDSGFTPIVCGFIGKTRRGEITTLGRGGSDVTAVVLANCLGSREVVLVKDVEGFYSADPRKVQNARLLKEVDVDEADLLTSSGAKVVSRKALRYLSDNVKIRVIGFNNGSLTSGGTLIKGGTLKLQLTLYSKPVFMVTVVGDKLNERGVIDLITEKIEGEKGKILAVVGEEKAAIFYVDGQASRILRKLHRLIASEEIGKAVSILDEIAFISLKGNELETTPGVIHRCVSPLAKEKINLYGLFTIHSSIKLFVQWDLREKAFSILKEEFKVT